MVLLLGLSGASTRGALVRLLCQFHPTEPGSPISTLRGLLTLAHDLVKGRRASPEGGTRVWLLKSESSVASEMNSSTAIEQSKSNASIFSDRRKKTRAKAGLSARRGC